MGPERWEDVARIYHSVCDRAPAGRSAFLVEACRGDEDLRREVESLLAHDASQDDFLECMARDGPLATAEAAPSGIALPANIGPFRIIRLVGEGGMGVVYQAEQDQPRRTVALKVVKPGFTRPETLRRFEQETQALGRLEHPGIARIYQAGAADTGRGPQPYFAMEFIRGLSLLEYARTHGLDSRERLRLMVKVCEAAHHAHAHGVIHRDLKPGNILVDESGQPKILDFGVARIAGARAAATQPTGLGELVGTLAYMSPEQVLGDSREVDARSDVYALGMVLYELLAGRLPYRVDSVVYKAVTVVRDQDPAPLSAIDRAFRGDIEAMVAKALEKDKANRYPSAAEMSADIERYLHHLPVHARRLGAVYQARKFARRHRGLAASAALVFVVLAAGVLLSSREAIRAGRAEHAALLQRDRATAAEKRATQERDRALRAELEATGERSQAQQERQRALQEKDRADTQSAVAKAVTDFLQNDLLAQADAKVQARPGNNPDPDLKVRTALDRAASRIGGRFADQPLVEAAVRFTIGSTYDALGLYREAQQHLVRSLELRTRALGAEHPDTLNAMNELAWIYSRTGNDAGAETMLAQVIAVRRRILGNDHPDTLRAINDLAILATRGDYARSEALLVEILAAERHVFGERNSETLAVMNNLASEYVNRGKYAAAEDLYTRVVEIKRSFLGEEHPSTLLSMNSLGVVYRNEGKYAQAEAVLIPAWNVRRRVMGEEHNDTLASMNSLALVYRAEGKYLQAEPLLRQVAEARSRVMGPEHAETLRTLANLAELYQIEGKRGEAEALFRRILETRRRTLGAQHPNTISALASLGELKLQQREYAEATPLLRDAVENYRRIAPDTWRRYYAESMLGASLTGSSQYAEAEPLLTAGYRKMMERQDSIPAENRPVLEQTRAWIAQLYDDWGKPGEAALWQPTSRRNPN